MAEQDSLPANARSSGERKRKWYNASLQHGSVKHKGKKKELGRTEWREANVQVQGSRQPYDRRADMAERQVKRQKREEEGGWDSSVLPAPFSKEEIEAEVRRPKSKVAVMIGYSGSGYKGMQINHSERTIEGDLYRAFVEAGAISKANANDPKKSTLVRCARTDKGVHAAGNVISLKLIIEDEDIVEKINAALSPQIRVWGIQRTTGSFNCYQACDSRWYEYLIPTHSFLPPHPDSHLAKKLKELAQEAGDLEGYESRQAEVKDFWAQTDKEYVKPILDALDESVRRTVLEDIHSGRESSRPPEVHPADLEDGGNVVVGEEEPGQIINEESTKASEKNEADIKIQLIEHRKAVEAAFKQVRNAYIAAKKAYRLAPERLERVEETLQLFVGTKKYHNYTVDKSFKDSSCKRYIKMFSSKHSRPMIINGTEWLSIKVHGQSFMMHQIRKMVAMAALVVRSGCPPSRIEESFENVNLAIPRAPGVGLLLERPVFTSYNEGPAAKFEREPIDFNKYEAEMNMFKQREIYERIYREEDQGSVFHTYFTQVDAAVGPQFLYLSSGGVDAVWKPGNRRRQQDDGTGNIFVLDDAFDSEDEEAAALNGGEEDEEEREG